MNIVQFQIVIYVLHLQIKHYLYAAKFSHPKFQLQHVGISVSMQNLIYYILLHIITSLQLLCAPGRGGGEVFFVMLCLS